METLSLGWLWVSMVRNDQHHPELLLLKWQEPGSQALPQCGRNIPTIYEVIIILA